MLKSLVANERIVTTIPKAKELRRFADRLITLAKSNSLADRRKVVAELMVRFNKLTPKERRAAKTGSTSAFNGDRKVVEKLFGTLGPRFQNRQGGYTRITRLPSRRVGDCASSCVLEYLPASEQ
jgi:large subunit ribosomal protein L17